MIRQKVYLIILNLMMVMKSKQKIKKDATRKHNAWKRRNKKAEN